MHAVIMQKCFIFLRFTKLCSCVELYSPKKLLATSLGDPNCSTISSYLRAAECSDSNSDSRFFKDDSISFFSFPLQHSCLESSFKSVKALDMDVVAPGYTEVGYEEVNDREWSEEDGAWLMLFRGLDEVEGFPLSTQIIDNVTVMIWHPEYGLIYLEARPEFELIKKEPVQILPEDEAMEYFNKVTERYQVEAEEADVQDIDIVYIVDQTALDEKTSVLVPCFRYKFTCKGEAEDFFWANDTIIGSSQKQGEMLVNAVNGSTDSIFGSEFLK